MDVAAQEGTVSETTCLLEKRKMTRNTMYHGTDHLLLHENTPKESTTIKFTNGRGDKINVYAWLNCGHHPR